MNMMGNAVVFGTDQNADSLKSVAPPPYVKSVLQVCCVSGKDDFLNGNRPFDVCSLF